MEGKLVLGRWRKPDLGVEWKATPGEGMAVEIGSPPSFLSLKKIGQLQQDAAAIANGLVLGSKETGPLKINESFSARGLPIVGEGGNVPGAPRVQFYEPGEARPPGLEPEGAVGKGLGTKAIATVATALVVFGRASTRPMSLRFRPGRRHPRTRRGSLSCSACRRWFSGCSSRIESAPAIASGRTFP